MQQKRENNYDLLRIICAIAVITIHVSAIYKNAITKEEIFGTVYTSHILTTALYNTLSRFAVPCFVMLSGAFILADERNAEYQYFYRKAFKNIGIPTLIFSILYTLYVFARGIVSVVFKGKEWIILLSPIKDALKGVPFYHMWYLYMLIGVYLLVPIIHRYKKDIENKTFNRTVWIFLVIACLSMWTSTHRLNWDIGSSFCYLGYFMSGYVIRKKTVDHKNSAKGVFFIAAGFIIELVLTYLQYGYLLQGIAEEDMKYRLIGPQCPLIVVSSVLIFLGFSMLNINKYFGRLSEATFLIYLFHAGIWDLLFLPLRKIVKTRGDNRIIIPAGIIIVFLLSYVLAIVYKRIWEIIDKRFHLSDKICKLIKLE